MIPDPRVEVTARWLYGQDHDPGQSWAVASDTRRAHYAMRATELIAKQDEHDEQVGWYDSATRFCSTYKSTRDGQPVFVRPR